MLPSNLIDLFRGSLFVLAHWFGGSFGAAIVAASIALRVALLPISLPAARRRLASQRAMRALAPQLEALKKRYAAHPDKLFAETQRLYATHGVSMVDRRMVVDALIQWPPAALLYSAIGRVGGAAGGFLWMRSLVSPDKALAAIAGLVAAGVAWLATASPDGAPGAQIAPLLIAGVLSFVILSHISGGVALYSITSSVIGGVEQAIARRTSRA